MNEDIKAGTVVKLASGGPAMTVEVVFGNWFAICSWFDGANLRKEAFAVVSLRQESM